MGRRLAPGCAAAAAALALVASAGAQDAAAPTEPIRITFGAAAGCPDQGAFAAEVRARTARARLAAEDEAARAFRVDIWGSGSPDGFRGRLVIEEPGGAAAVREVAGRSCGEVVSALALISALAIDPKASTAAAPPPAPPPEPAVPAPGAASPSTEPAPRIAVVPQAAPWWTPGPPPRTPASVQRAAPAPAIWPPEPLPALVPPGHAEPPRWALGAGGHGGAFFGLSPDAAPGLLVFADAAWVGAGAIAPAFRAGLAIATSGTLAAAGGTARFRWLAGRIDGCPLRLGAAPLVLLPCLALQAGALEATGEGNLFGGSATRPWLAGGVLGRAQVEIAGWLLLEAEAGLSFPVVRDTFYFEPSATVHEVPAASGNVSAGALLRFR